MEIVKKNKRTDSEGCVNINYLLETSHKRIILDRSEKIKVDKNMVQDYSCMQDNWLMTKADIPIKLSSEVTWEL